MRLPSGDQRGCVSRSPDVSGRAALVATSTSHSDERYSSAFSSTRTRVNTMREPSGEISGSATQ